MGKEGNSIFGGKPEGRDQMEDQDIVGSMAIVLTTGVSVTGSRQSVVQVPFVKGTCSSGSIK
jgi:hypothetical protein